MTNSETGVLNLRPVVLLALGAGMCVVSKWMLETMLAASASGWKYQMALGVGVLLGIQGLGGMATAVARQYQEVSK